MPTTIAIKSGITCSVQAMYARIRRWNRHQAVAKANTETDLAAGALLDLSHTAPDSSPNTTGPTLHASKMPGSEKAPSDKPASEKAPSDKSGFEKAPPDKPHRISPSQSAKKQGKPTTLTKARPAALDSIPEWMDRDTTSSALGKRKIEPSPKLHRIILIPTPCPLIITPDSTMRGRGGPHITGKS